MFFSPIPQTVYCWGSQCKLTLVASVLVGVVAFLGSQVVLSPVVCGCPLLRVGVGVGWCGSLPGLSSRFVSGCLPLCVGVGVGWCGSLPGLSSRVVSRCFRLPPTPTTTTTTTTSTTATSIWYAACSVPCARDFSNCLGSTLVSFSFFGF